MATLTWNKPQYYKFVDETLLQGSIGDSYFYDVESEKINLESSLILKISYETTMDFSFMTVSIVNGQIEAHCDGQKLSEWAFDDSLFQVKSISNFYKLIKKSKLWEWIIEFIIADHYDEYESYHGLSGCFTSGIFPRVSEIFNLIIDDLECSNDWEERVQDLHWDTECFEREHDLNFSETYRTLGDEHPIKSRWNGLEKDLFKDFLLKKRVFGAHQILWRDANISLLISTLSLMKKLDFSDWQETGFSKKIFHLRTYNEIILFLNQITDWLNSGSDENFQIYGLQVKFNFDFYDMSHPWFFYYRSDHNYLIPSISIAELELVGSELITKNNKRFGDHETLTYLIFDRCEGDLHWI